MYDEVVIRMRTIEGDRWELFPIIDLYQESTLSP